MDENQYVVFGLGQEEFGIDIQRIQEIIRIPKLTKMPGTPPYVVGITNLRGNVISIVDLRQRFGLPNLDFGEETRIIIVKFNDIVRGIIVDYVSEVLKISANDIEKVADLQTGVDDRFISGVAKQSERLVLILKLEEAL